MATISKDVSGKIEKPIVDALAMISEISSNLELPFFLIGAKARDIFFSALFDIPTHRATLDVDIGIKAKSWEDAKRLVDDLTATGEFVRVKGLQFRLKHTNGVVVDVIPFGELESPQGKIQWPDDDAVMTTTGFDEAFEYSMHVRIRTDLPLDVRICSPPAMVVLKLIAWEEKYPERADDAVDIKYILENYLEADNDKRLYGEDSDLHDEKDFDYGRASARILGRDVAKIVTPVTMATILEILDRETNEKSDFRLIIDMMRGNSREGSFEETLSLLNQLKQGIIDRPRTSSNG